jgi:TonB family protein
VVEIDHKDGVWIEDCCELSRFIEEHFDRDVEDFELEVGSAGIGQPLKVLQQYINAIGYDVELLTAEGKKMEGMMKSADEEGFVVTVIEKQKVEGKVMASFIVETDGSISEVKILKPVFPSLDAEAVRVISAMPNWKPGKQKGQAVRVHYVVPISFRLK